MHEITMTIRNLIMTIICGASLSIASAAELEESFQNPPDSARPGVYWYFMDGNMDRDEMVADLEAMKEVGIGSVLFLEVNIGTPVGPVAFMSEKWQDNLVHAIKTTERLGMEFILGTGPGWSGSGGSWVRPEDSMQHLLGSITKVKGPVLFEEAIAVPAPHTPNKYAGMNKTHSGERNKWYQDVAVLAFPTPKKDFARFVGYDIKTLKDVGPYSSMKHVPTTVEMSADFTEPDAAAVISMDRVVDLTSRMKPDGTLRWDVPDGDWTVMRFVARSTGQTTRPAPRAGHGFECDKFNADAYRRHWENFQAKLVEKLGPLTKGRGLTTIHLDSWEMSSQNWSAAFREEFRKRRGYDPQPFYPAYMGLVVGSLEKTERFLWDMRITSQELVLENHAGAIRKIAHEHGLLYSNEPYDMNPAGNIDLGSVADIPVCEFWNVEGKIDTQYSCIEAVSIAHTMGRPQVNAEAFTTRGMEYLNYPGSMKNQTDWAFAMGINGIIFHTFQHQPLGNGIKPGMTMGPYGVQWHRNRAIWPLLPGYHEYIARCSHLLRQGAAVADILYLTPEGAPHIFLAPETALAGSPRLKDKKGYNFDAVTPRILKMRANVKDGKIAFPNGTSYSLLVLPDVSVMTPETLERIIELAEDGATIIGNPPSKSPSLAGYPECDTKVKQLAAKLWGSERQPEKKVGEGLYPTYAAVAEILERKGIPEDFRADVAVRYGHRRTDDKDIYFVANTSDKQVKTDCIFRVETGSPELWDPVTGEIRNLPQFTRQDKVTSVPMSFAPYQSFFVVFPFKAASAAQNATSAVNFCEPTPMLTIEGPWTVSFDPEWGGPEKTTFETLQDWSRHSEGGIRYYSGLATYRKTFDLTADPAKGDRIYLDLGKVHDLCRVRLNGLDLGIVWTAPWRVDITKSVKAKGNQLEIEVGNRWVNRLIGDQQPGDKDVRTLSWASGLLGGKSFKTGRYTFTTSNPYRENSKLEPAGLLGPVSILTTGPDTFAPNGTGFVPADDTTTTCFLPSSLVMTFSEPLAAGIGNITIKNLSDSSQVAINVTDGSQVSIDDNRLRITPAGGFEAGKNYAIRIDAGAITDAAGNSFAGIADDTTWNFATSATGARVIVQDGFSGAFAAGNGVMAGRTPDTLNLPGNTYTEQQNANVQAKMEFDATTGIPGNGNSLKTGFNNSAHIRYSNSGTPAVPITLSIDLQINTIAGNDDPRGIGLGFWSPLPTLFPGAETFATTHFTGIMVNPGGTLEYVRGGVSQGVFTTAPAGFSAAAFLNLTYTVDPSAGDILHLEFAGNDYTADFTSSFPANFSASDTAGFLGSTSVKAAFFGRVDNFIIATSGVLPPTGLRNLVPADDATGVPSPLNSK